MQSRRNKAIANQQAAQTTGATTKACSTAHEEVKDSNKIESEDNIMEDDDMSNGDGLLRLD